MSDPMLVTEMSVTAVLLPALAAALILLLHVAVRILPDAWTPPGRFWPILGALLSLLPLAHVVFVLWPGFDPERIGFQAIVHRPWLPELGLNLFLGVDGISLLMVGLVTLLVPVVLTVSQGRGSRGEAGFAICVLLIEAGLLGSFLSLSWVGLHISFELTALALYFLVGVWGDEQRGQSATRMLVTGFLGSLCLVVAMVVVYGIHARQMGSPTLDLVAFDGSPGLLDTKLPLGSIGFEQLGTQHALLLLMALGFALKTPVFPLHVWMPRSHAAAPVAGRILLLGAVQTLGIYGLVRIALPLATSAATVLAPWLMALLALGAVYAALLALAQRELRDWLAYASMVQMAFVTIGVLSLGELGMTGGFVLLLAHGLGMSALLSLAGAIAERRETTEIAALGGLARPMPVFAALFALSAFSLMGLPLLPGFVGELLVLLGTFRADRLVGLALCLVIFLFGLLLFDMVRRVILGPVHQAENRGLIDLSWRERALVLVLLVPMLVIGIHPDPVLRRVEPAVLEVLRRMDQNQVTPDAQTEPEPDQLPAQEMI